MKKYFITTLLLLSAWSTTAYCAADVAAGKQKSVTCAACHGADGNSTNPDWPKIAGQRANYIIKQLRDYRIGQNNVKKHKGRENPIMHGISQSLSEQDMLDIAAYYSTQAGSIGATQEDLVERGEQLYRGGDLDKHVAACAACHGPKGEGLESAAFPRLAGQHAEYIVAQLQAFRSGQRANDINGMMEDIAGRMSDEDILAVASYINGLH